MHFVLLPCHDNVSSFAVQFLAYGMLGLTNSTLPLLQSYNLCYIGNEGKKKKRNQLRARRALTLFNDFLQRIRRALSLYRVYGDSTLLVLNRTLLNSDIVLLVLSRRTDGNVCVVICYLAGVVSSSISMFFYLWPFPQLFKLLSSSYVI